VAPAAKGTTLGPGVPVGFVVFTRPTTIPCAALIVTVAVPVVPLDVVSVAVMVTLDELGSDAGAV